MRRDKVFENWWLRGKVNPRASKWGHTPVCVEEMVKAAFDAGWRQGMKRGKAQK